MIAIIRRFLVLLVRILVGARSEWRGCAPDPSRRIYFANHNSHIDTVAVMAALPWPVRRMTHPVAARDYWGTSAFRRFIAEKGLRAVLIDRKPLPDTDPLAPIERLLEEGRSVLIFPEGTRSTTDEIAPFRSGIFALPAVSRCRSGADPSRQPPAHPAQGKHADRADHLHGALRQTLARRTGRGKG